jgi:hypothetical protein
MFTTCPHNEDNADKSSTRLSEAVEKLFLIPEEVLTNPSDSNNPSQK